MIQLPCLLESKAFLHLPSFMKVMQSVKVAVRILAHVHLLLEHLFPPSFRTRLTRFGWNHSSELAFTDYPQQLSFWGAFLSGSLIVLSAKLPSMTYLIN